MAPARRVCVIIGGRGFLGKFLTKQLLSAAGEDAWEEVRVMDIAPSLTLSPEEKQCPVTTAALKDGRLVYVCADVTKLPDVKRACKGAFAAFHMASPSPENKSFPVHYTVSVLGAKNVVKACLEEGVGLLVYTSSASVVFDGNQDLKGIDETFPCASKHMSVYGETKAQAEAIVLAANGKNGLLRTCSLRPSNIFGPGDLVLTPAVARNAAAGKLKECIFGPGDLVLNPAMARNGAAEKLKIEIGDGRTQADWTYVENVAAAHLCAERALRRDFVKGAWEASGKAYFITNNSPRPIWGFLLQLASALGYNVKVVARLPGSVVLPLSYVAEAVFKNLEPLGVKPSDFTPFRMKVLTRWKVYSGERAKTLLGYTPQVSVEEGIQRTAAANPHLRAEVLMAEKAK